MSPAPQSLPGPVALTAGAELPAYAVRVTRADLVRYAGASGDRNPIHWSDRVAAEVGLPGVIAHGMLTLGLVGSALGAWTDHGEVHELGAKFTAPVVVPDTDEGTEVVVAGTVKAVADGRATLALQVTCDGGKVLGNPRAVVAVPGA